MATFNELKRTFPALLESGVSIELISAPGRGKSTFIEDLIAYLSKRDGFQWGLSVAMLATYSPIDLLGYMIPGKDAQGQPESQFTRPAWMTSVEGKDMNSYRRGIVFLDEWGQAEGDVKRASANLILNKSIGPWRLNPGISVVAASNRANDRSGVTKNFDFVINRRLELHVKDDIESFEDWAVANNVSPEAIVFAKQNPATVFSEGVPDKQGPWCTPRSLVMMDRVHTAMADGNGGDRPVDTRALEVANGLIGEGAATLYFAMVRLAKEMPTYEEILKQPKVTKVPGKPDAQMLVCYNLAARVTEGEVDRVVEYVERFPKEFAVTFAKAACKRDPDLVNSAAFGGWCARNSALMTAITDHR